MGCERRRIPNCRIWHAANFLVFSKLTLGSGDSGELCALAWALLYVKLSEVIRKAKGNLVGNENHKGKELSHDG